MSDYARGSIAWGTCQRCGLRTYYRLLVLDGYYPNIRVCSGCYDPPQPQERLAVVSDPVALWKPAPEPYYVNPPLLTAEVVAGNVVLAWTSIGGPPVGSDQVGGQSCELSAGYVVFRSVDAGLTFPQLVAFTNTADEFGALSIETLTYTDVAPPVNEPQYYVLGYDVLQNAEYS